MTRGAKIIIGLMIAAALAGGAYMYQQKQDTDAGDTTNTNTTTNQTSNTNRTNTNTVAANTNATNTNSTNSNTNTSTNTNATTNANANSNGNTNSTAIEEDPNKRVVNVYFIDLEDNGANGDLVGCGDSAVPVQKTVTVSSQSTQAAIYASLSTLFVNDNRLVEAGKYYNALYQSDLTMESVTVINGKATVKITGTTQLGGTCDDPRFQAQIEKTVRQFSDVTSTAIYINEKLLAEVVSQQ